MNGTPGNRAGHLSKRTGLGPALTAHALRLCALAGCAAALAGEPVAPAGGTGEARVTVVADFADGSRLVGTPTTDRVSVATAVGTMTIPLKHVSRIVLAAGGEPSAVLLANGDRLSGTPELGTFGLDTLLGRALIGRAQLRTLNVSSSAVRMPAELRKGLLLHYVFDRNPGAKARDLSDADCHGKIRGATWAPDPIMGGVLVFKGENDAVEFSAAGFPAGPAPRTLAAWVSQNRTDGGRHYVIGYGGDPSGTEFRLSLNELAPSQFSVETGMGGWHSSASLLPRRWYHLAVTYGGSGAPKFYVNGREVPMGGPYLGPAVRTVAGGGTMGMRGSNEGGGYLAGKLAEVAAWNRELSAVEIDALCRARPGAADAASGSD